MKNQTIYVLGIRISAFLLLVLILLWLGRELGFLTFSRPKDLITPGFALAVLTLSLSYLKRGKNK